LTVGEDEGRKRGCAHRRRTRASPTSATNIAGRGVAMLALLATIPAVMRHLTQEEFGLWMRLSSLIAMRGFSGLCIGNKLLSGVSAARRRQCALPNFR
jgi:hypothetical protein